MEQLAAAASEREQRVPDMTRLVGMSNQIMELVLENIRLLHLNSKLVDYCKRQVSQSEFAMKSME